MEHFMVNQINVTCSQIDMGIIYNSPLPATLLDYGTPRRPSDDKTTSPDKKKTDDSPEWWKINPDPVADWLLPPGKKFKEFFDPPPKTDARTCPVFPRFAITTPKSQDRDISVHPTTVSANAQADVSVLIYLPPR